MIDLHLSAFAPRWRFLYVVRIDAYGQIYGISKMAVSKRLKKLHEKLGSSVS